MFNSISGTITGKFPQKVFIENNGIEWDITMPDTSLDVLPNVGERAKVYVWLQHTENAMILFGFSSSKDRDLFFDLNKVDGVGPKSAIKIMSSIAREQLVASLDSGDLAALEKIPGLGKKTAQKMLLALKGKLTLDEDLPSVAKQSPNRGGEYADVIKALSEMGYDRRQVEECIEILFRRAIINLAQ